MILFTSTIINITGDNINEMLGWTTTIIDNLKALWLLIVGVLLGITVLVIVLRAVRGDKE